MTKSNAPTSATELPSIAEAIKSVRKAKGLSLEDLAAKSHVSRSMLSQIERDSTNPTVATLWKITDALGINIQELLGHAKPKTPIEVVDSHAIPRISSADQLIQLRVLGPLELAGEHEWYELEAQPKGRLVSNAHSLGTVEHLYVVEGELQVDSAGQSILIPQGSKASYPADVAHEIKNAGKKTAKAWLTVMLKK